MGRLFREPDEDSGPALLDREPVILPEERKEVAERVKSVVNGNNSNSEGDGEGDDGDIHRMREEQRDDTFF